MQAPNTTTMGTRKIAPRWSSIYPVRIVYVVHCRGRECGRIHQTHETETEARIALVDSHTVSCSSCGLKYDGGTR